MMKSAQTLLVVTAAIAMAAAAAIAQDRDSGEGGRKVQDGEYTGFTGLRWDEDFGIRSGRCRHDLIDSIVGLDADEAGPSGDAMVARVSRTAGGVPVGNRIGRNLDAADRACFAHALELGRTGQTVAWTNVDSGVRFEMVPGDVSQVHGTGCREYELRSIAGATVTTIRGTACNPGNGAWKIRG